MAQHRDHSNRSYLGVCPDCFSNVRYSWLDERGVAVDRDKYHGDMIRSLHPHNDQYGFKKCSGIGKEPYGDGTGYYEPW